MGPIREVANHLVCQCGGCTSVLPDCPHENCSSRTKLVSEISLKLDSGASLDETVDFMAESYGSQILAAPPMKGFHLTAWAVPVLIWPLGLALIFFVIRFWGRRPLPAVEKPPVADQGEWLERVEKDLKEGQ